MYHYFSTIMISFNKKKDWKKPVSDLKLEGFGSLAGSFGNEISLTPSSAAGFTFADKRLKKEREHQSLYSSPFSKSFSSIKSRSQFFAFWCIGLGFLSLIVLTFLFPYLIPASILLMFGGAVTGIGSSFMPSGRALTYIRKASSSASSGDYEGAVDFLEKAYSLRPTLALKENIDEIKTLAGQKSSPTRN